MEPGDYVAIAEPMFPDDTQTMMNNIDAVRTSLEERGLDDALMVVTALATIKAELGDFNPRTEGMSRYNTYFVELPLRVGSKYERRPDMGNASIGDGQRYVGRGFVQLTWKSNYVKYGALSGHREIVENPEKANDPEVAGDILAAYLDDHRKQIERALSKGIIGLPEVRAAVNGGQHGFEAFQAAFLAGVRVARERNLIDQRTFEIFCGVRDDTPHQIRPEQFA